MSEALIIQSHRGPYSVVFDETVARDAGCLVDDESHFLIDAGVARLYATSLRSILADPRAIVIEATEESKSLAGIAPVLESLLKNKIRRDHVLVAIGGGIIQDITCFIASTLLRGLAWRFVPTTLLAQADSCIGSKSSINLGAVKNILGTFNPPRDVLIGAGFLDTLENKDMRSGIGEILKVHAIDGAASFDRLAADYDRLLNDRTVLAGYIQEALRIKRRYIEKDEFDRGVRNIFNYGHSFGHAIESAVHYAIPHGIAVSIGMDMANDIAVMRGLLPRAHYQRMHPVLRKNYGSCTAIHIPLDAMLDALNKDKKNIGAMLSLIFATGEHAEIRSVRIPADEIFRLQCAECLAGISS